MRRERKKGRRPTPDGKRRSKPAQTLQAGRARSAVSVRVRPVPPGLLIRVCYGLRDGRIRALEQATAA